MTERRPRFHLPIRRNGSRTATATAEPAPEVSMESKPAVTPLPAEQSIVDAALYRDGRRVDSPSTLAEISSHLRDDPNAMAWIGLFRPAESQLLAVADEFGLHDVAVEDAIVAHQRPKLERYGATLFVVLRAARYLDDVEEVEFGEIHVFVGRNFVLTVRHS
ncbi:MAG TPA: CorA family divalent cation transporter, partial [Candidatus Eisenbacteria bacterium]|nr:CorA family divalent cation transporter [Candidatus Eisenbacteria bacterium]